MDIEPNGHWQGESQSYSQNSQSVAIHNEAGDIEHCAGVFSDISTQTHKNMQRPAAKHATINL